MQGNISHVTEISAICGMEIVLFAGKEETAVVDQRSSLKVIIDGKFCILIDRDIAAGNVYLRFISAGLHIAVIVDSVPVGNGKVVFDRKRCIICDSDIRILSFIVATDHNTCCHRFRQFCGFLRKVRVNNTGCCSTVDGNRFIDVQIIMQINKCNSVSKGNRLFTVQCFCVSKDHTQRVCKARIVRRCNGKAAHGCRIDRRQRVGTHVECIKRENTGHTIQCGGINQAGNDRFAAGFRIGSGVLQTVIGRIRCIKRIRLITTDLLPDAVAFRISCEVIVAAIQFSDQRTAAGCLGICFQGISLPGCIETIKGSGIAQHTVVTCIISVYCVTAIVDINNGVDQDQFPIALIGCTTICTADISF